MDCADFRTNLKCVDNYLRSGGCVMMLDHCEMRCMLMLCFDDEKTIHTRSTTQYSCPGMCPGMYGISIFLHKNRKYPYFENTWAGTHILQCTW